MRIGREEWLRSLGIVLMILVRVALVDVREQVPLMLQVEMLEKITVMIVIVVMIVIAAPGLKPASERFMKRKPQVFEGSVDPVMAEEWINMIEKIFEFI